MTMELARLAITNLGRSKGRLIMTALGVVVGTSAVLMLIALTFGLQRAAEAGIGASGALTEIQVYPNYGFGPFGGGGATEGEPPQLDVDAVALFRRLPGVQAVIPMLNMQYAQLASDDYFGYAQIIGVDPALMPYLGVQAQTGDLALAAPTDVVLGGRVNEQFYDPEAEGDYQPIVLDWTTAPLEMQVFQSSGTSYTQRNVDLTIRGVLATGNNYDGTLLMPLREVMRWNEWASGVEYDPETFVYDQITIRASSRETTTAVSEAVRTLGYVPSGLGEYINQINGFFNALRLFLGGIGFIALVVAAIGVVNTMAMAVLERTREIGLMKAIGATDRDVLSVFLIEAGLIGFVGGVVGVGVAYLLQNAANNAIANLPPPDPNAGGGVGGFLPVDISQLGGELFVIPSEYAAFAVVLAVVVGLAAGFVPALRAARMVPVNALRSE